MCRVYLLDYTSEVEVTDCRDCKIFIGDTPFCYLHSLHLIFSALAEAAMFSISDIMLLQALSMDLQFLTTAKAVRSLLLVNSSRPRAAGILNLVSCRPCVVHVLDCGPSVQALCPSCQSLACNYKGFVILLPDHCLMLTSTLDLLSGHSHRCCARL